MEIEKNPARDKATKTQIKSNSRYQSGRTPLGNADRGACWRRHWDSSVIILKNLETNAAMRGDGCKNAVTFIAFWSSAKYPPDYISSPGFSEMPRLPIAQCSPPQ